MSSATKPVTSEPNLPRLSRRVVGTGADGHALPESIVQFGTGGFLRGFVDAFVDQANRRGSRGPGRVVVVGSTGSGRVADLNDQDGLYTLLMRGRAGGSVVDETRIIHSISRAISAADDWPEVLELARSPHIHTVVSNTTEVGIRHDPNDRPDLQPPASFPGKLTAFLAVRAEHFDYDVERGLAVLPCELIQDNGDRLRDIVETLAHEWKLGARFMAWLDRSVIFCNTLVDRIVPGIPDGEEASRLCERLGYDDRLLTVAEPYRLWAIQIPAGHSAEQLALRATDEGVIIVDDIRPYRERKVRILNGTHTAIVPAALLFEFATVAQAVGHAVFGRFVSRMVMDEIVPSLDVDHDMAASFARDVLERFANPFIRHELVDISLQQTAKMDVRVMPSICGYTARHGSIPPLLTFAFAAFIEYKLRTCGEGGLPHDDANGFWSEMAALDRRSGIAAVISSVVGSPELWKEDLEVLPGFVSAVTRHVTDIRRDGIASALALHLAQPVTDRTSSP